MHPSRRRPAILQLQPISAKRLRLSGEDTRFESEGPRHNLHHDDGHIQKTDGESGSFVPSKPNYDRLPDLPLISILEKIPLVDLLPLRVLSQRFDNIASTMVIKKRSALNLVSYYDSNLSSTYARTRFDLSRFLDIDLHSPDFIIGIDETVYRKWIAENKGGESKENRVSC